MLKLQDWQLIFTCSLAEEKMLQHKSMVSLVELLQIAIILFGLMFKLIQVQDALGQAIVLKVTVISWWHWLMVSLLKEKLQVFIHRLLCGKTFLEVLQLAQQLLRHLYGMLTTITFKLLVICGWCNFMFSWYWQKLASMICKNTFYEFILLYSDKIIETKTLKQYQWAYS